MRPGPKRIRPGSTRENMARFGSSSHFRGGSPRAARMPLRRPRRGLYIYFQMTIPAVEATGINQRIIIQRIVRRDISIRRMETKIGMTKVRLMERKA